MLIKHLRREQKFYIYKTVIRPTILYEAETTSMTKIQENDFRILERKCLRNILGPVKTTDNENELEQE